MSNNYEIGYGKPPMHTRFKKGMGGNKKGRLKKHEKDDVFDLIEKELNSKVTLKDGNKISKKVALIRQFCNKASSGDYKSGKLLLDITAKQQSTKIATLFVNKLIKENYISEKHVKEYINENKPLETKSIPAAVYNLYRGASVAKAKAEMSVLGTVFLASIWAKFVLTYSIASVVEAVTHEYYFWEGIEKSLDYVDIDEKQREKVIRKMEQDRGIARPDKSLYDTSVKLYEYTTSLAVDSFLIIRETYETRPGYEESEKEMFSNENQDYMFSMIKSETNSQEYESTKNVIEEFYKEYSSFVKFPFDTKKGTAFSKKPKKDELIRLMNWHMAYLKLPPVQI